MIISHKNYDISLKYLEFLISEYNFRYEYEEDLYKTSRTFKRYNYTLVLENVHTQKDSFSTIYVLNNGWKSKINLLESLVFYNIKFSRFILMISQRYYYKLIADLIRVQISDCNGFFGIKLDNERTK